MATGETLAKYKSGKDRVASLEGELAALEDNLAAAEANIAKAQAAIGETPANMASAAASLDQAAAFRAALVKARQDLEDNKAWRDAIRSAIDTKKSEISHKRVEVMALHRGIWKEKRGEIVAEILAHSALFKKLHAVSILAGMPGVTLPQRLALLVHESFPVALPADEMAAIQADLEAEVRL